MKESIIAFIKTHMMGTLIGIATAIVVGIIVTIVIVSSNEEGELALLEAGVADIPVIKSKDLDILAKRYSELNEQFEREIDKLTTGVPNRHNLSDNRENALKHYGVYGQDNPTKFKNDDYINGINITYEKTDPSKQNGASNFNDILAVMSVMYDQQMDTVETNKLLETLETLFWLSHTYTFDSTELYPCKSGCSSVNYHCTDVYKDYTNTNLKYDPFTVKAHDLYENYSSDDFKIQVPERTCEVHGQKGAGCKWLPDKVCYHSSSSINFVDYNDKIDKKEIKEGSGADTSVETFEGVKYAELGDIIIPEYEDEKFLGIKPVVSISKDDKDESTSGMKIDKKDHSCIYYMEVKYCKERKRIGNEIIQCKANIYDLNNDIYAENERFDKIEEPSEGDYNNHSNTLDILRSKIAENEARIQSLQIELDNHIKTKCESNNENAKYWCDGFKVCLGHRTHYECKGHKVIVCFGHTTINVVVKILYGDYIMKKVYDVLD